MKVEGLKGSIGDINGSWYFVVDVGKDQNGKRKQVKRRGFLSKDEAIEALKNFEYKNIEILDKLKKKRYRRNDDEISKNKKSNKNKYVTILYHISEEELEDLLINNMHKIEDGMHVIGNQVEIDNGRVDILARDKNNKLCVIELKVVSDDKNIVYQAAYYPTQFDEPTRIITICPDYTNYIKEALYRVRDVEMKTFYFDRKEELLIEDYEEDK